ncbi:MAG: glycosyltransferase family 39 protein [Lachnospiraceae bacterium]|nr:glycosyltransferase family 39 protein [Lachnospiraceae bacterium]
MLEKAKQFIWKQKLNIVLLIMVTVFGAFYISQKEGYHMDEMLSFELANAEFTPWIVTTQPVGRLEKFVQNEIYGETVWETWGNFFETVKDVFVNRGNSKLLSYKADVYPQPVWITQEQFKDYIEVGERDDFNYFSVYFNVKDDNHPPFHFMAVHTISSIFKGQVTPWMGCVINLILVLGICVILLKIGKEFWEDEKIGVLGCILYAFSMAGVSTVLLIRMYAMLTFWCMFALYLHMKKLRSGEWESKNKLLIFVTFAGFFTQYYFVIFMLFLAIITLVLMKQKHWYYVRSMAIAAVIGLCVYPFSILHVLFSGRGVESVQNLGSGLSGLGERFYYFGKIIKEEVLGGTIGMCILLLVFVVAVIIGVYHKYARKAEVEKTSETDRCTVTDSKKYLLQVAVPCFGYFLVAVKIAPFYADRYLMPVFPLFALLLAILISKLFSGRWAFLVAVLMLLPNVIMVTPLYLYKGYEQQVKIAEQAEVPCVCVYHGVGYYQNLVEFTYYPQTLMVTEEELLGRMKDAVLSEQEEIVLLLENGVNREQVYTYLEKEYGYKVSEVLMDKGVHGDHVVACRK